jgi:DNA helicase-2/ATP-dependent DNA helicase PcrA
MSELNGEAGLSGQAVALPQVAKTDQADLSASGQSWLSTLNSQQREVVLHRGGPLLVLAVAGSGKTRAIAHRAAYLISGYGVCPSQILCLTFTNKAAEEMRERIGQLLAGHRSGITVATFHALCARLLRLHHALIKRTRRFVIYDNEDVARVGKEVAKELGAEGCREQLLAEIERLKHHGILPHEDLSDLANQNDQQSRYRMLVHQAYQLYEQKLARYDALDFTDLLLKTILMLENHPEVMDHLRHRYRHILVDEYQDTCPLQERLLQILASPAYNLCVVGDDDQAIYAFRHADVGAILTFESRYPKARVIRMEQNYRSTGAIIEVARRVISANERRHPKSIHTANAHGLPVEVVGFASEEAEAAWIARTLRDLNAQGVRYGEFAILCRVASLFRPIERELTAALIPYVLVDGLAFWERRGVKDVMAYLRFIHNPLDYLSFRRIANVPPRGLGKKALNRIEEALKSSPSTTLTEILQEASHCPSGGSTKLRSFLCLIESLRKESGTVSSLIETILNRVGYEAYLMKTFPDAMRRVANLMQLVSIARRFEKDPGVDLSEFLLQSGLSATDQEIEGDSAQSASGGVRLMTIHAAKGLEFRAVFVVGLEDGILPHARCRESASGGLEEERRLFYVAVTRAMDRLFLSWSARRMIQGREMNHLVSPFVREILPWHGGHWPMAVRSETNGQAIIYYSPSASGDSMRSGEV